MINVIYDSFNEACQQVKLLQDGMRPDAMGRSDMDILRHHGIVL
jgi:hypothetical protein